MVVAARADESLERLETGLNVSGRRATHVVADVCDPDDVHRIAHPRKKGGAIIYVGSEVSDHSIPLQGASSASKHALKAYTDTLRIELEDAGIPISVTLVNPTGIANPFFEHAKNYMPAEPIAPPPMYAPDVVAEAILYTAENPTRDFLAGESAVLNSLLGRVTPGSR